MKFLHSGAIAIFCIAPLVNGNWFLLLGLWYLTLSVMLATRDLLERYVWQVAITNDRITRTLQQAVRP